MASLTDRLRRGRRRNSPRPFTSRTFADSMGAPGPTQNANFAIQRYNDIARGYEVRTNTQQLQKFLAQQGFQLAQDGVFGAQTDAAFRSYLTRTQGSVRRNAQQQQIQQRRLNQETAQFQMGRLSTGLSTLARAGANEQEIQEAVAGAGTTANLSQLAAYTQELRARADERLRASQHRSPIERLGGGILDLVGKPIEEVALQPLYAAQRALTNNPEGSTWDKANRYWLAFGQALPGLGRFAEGETRRAIEETNSPEERARLTEQGELASWGQVATGNAPRSLYGPGGPPIRLPRWTSGAADFTLQVAADPLNVVGGVFNDFARIGQGLTPAARAAKLQGTLGRNLLDAATSVVARNQDVASLRRAIPGLPSAVADDVLAAAREGGTAAARETLSEAFVRGTWNPSVELKNRALTPVLGPRAIGRSAVRQMDVGAAVRSVVRGRVPVATFVSNKADLVLRNAVESSMVRAGRLLPDFYDEVVAPAINGLTPLGRVRRLITLADNQNAAAFDDIVRHISGLARKDIKAFNAAVTDPSSVASRLLREAEVAAEVLGGAAGDLARKQAEASLTKGLITKPLKATDLASTARKNVGLGTRSKVTPLPNYNAARYERMVRALANTRLTGALKDKYLTAVAEASGNKTALAKLLRDVDEMLADKSLLREAERLAENEGTRIAQGAIEATRPGVVKRLAASPLAMVESMPPNSIAFQGAANPDMARALRVEGFDRWMAALGMDDAVRASGRRTVESIKTEEELFTTVRSMLTVVARDFGIEPKKLHQILENDRRVLRDRLIFSMGETGQPVKAIQTLAQRIEDVPLPDPSDIRRTAVQELARQGDVGANIRTGLSAAAGTVLRATPTSRAAIGAVAGATVAQGDADDRFQGAAAGAAVGFIGPKNLHTVWKWAIVTNVPAIGIGGVAGALYDEENRAKGALVGAGIGALAPVRYILRVAVIEEKLRTYMRRGFTPVEFIPGVSKWYRRRGLTDLPFQSGDIVRAGNQFGHHLSNRFLTSIDGSWAPLRITQPRAIDAWWRIANYQIHVETDELARIFVSERAGLLTRAQANDAAAKFLKSDDGRLAFKRLKSGYNGPKSEAEAILRYREFVDTHLPTAELASDRLAGQVTRESLRATKKAGAAPPVIHAQRTWIMPRTAKDLLSTTQQLTAKMVLGGPTTRMNRIPMAEHIYAQEVGRLLGEGVDPAMAQRIADEFATTETNRIMFQIDDESRFAAKVDFVFPFQQPREEILRVWGRMIAKNPAKAGKVVRLAALALNNGEETGIFRKDPFTGEYVLTVPGSAYIGQKLFGTNHRFEARLRDLLFIGQGAYGVGFIPSPGGPYWSVATRLYFDRHPDDWMKLKNEHPGFHQLLFPYSPTGKLLRNEPNRLWMAMAGDTPPWEFANRWGQEQELDKWTREVALQLKHEHYKETGDADWWPTDEQLTEAMRGFFQAWAFFGGIFPSSSRPIMPGREEMSALIESYKDAEGNIDYDSLISEHPIAQAFLAKQSKYVGPDDFEHWTRQEADRAEQYAMKYREQTNYADLRKFLAEQARTTQAYREQRSVLANPDRADREAGMLEWRRKYPDLAEKYRTDYARNRDLHTILTAYPDTMREQAIDRWRQDYDVSYTQYQRLATRVRREFEVNPWRDARYPEDVVAAVDAQVGRGLNREVAVANLMPAEQVRYWDSQIANISYYSGAANPQSTLDRYYDLRQRRSAVFAAHPELAGGGDEPSGWERKVAEWRGDVREQTSATYEEINRIAAAMQTAAAGKDWDTYYALRDKRTALYDHVKALKNEQYQGLRDYTSEVKATLALLGPVVPAQWSAFNQQTSEANGFIFVASNEETNYLSMPDNVRQAYVDDILTGLQTPNGERGKMFWEWLTDFQQDLLERNLPGQMIQEFQRERPGQTGGGSNTRGQGGQSYGGSSGRGGGNSEMSWARSMFQQYTQRPSGARAPAGYSDYLALPNNPAMRSEFLKKNPQVAEWIRSGPMANMPETVRYMVTNIMVKYGEWEGEQRSMTEISELAFAREQLRRWNMRTGPRPATYDFWLNMPTGIEKAQYLAAHPEVKDWISLGPMVNMPEEYQEVVRDIMQRYGEWTQSQDPLGITINGYYALPSYARRQYLEQHPELVAYWAATRSPEEQAMFALSDHYYGLQDPAAQRLFLAAHPELKEWFVTQRTKRYERFLNKVALYMGSNPELFTEYLERQEDILSELLRNYGEPNLVREVRNLTAPKDSKRAKQRKSE